MKMAASGGHDHFDARREPQSGLTGDGPLWSLPWLAISAASAAIPSRPRSTGEMPKPWTGGGTASATGGGGTSVAGRTQPVWPWTAAEPAAAAADAVCVQTVCADAWVPKALMATKGLT